LLFFSKFRVAIAADMAIILGHKRSLIDTRANSSVKGRLVSQHKKLT